MQHGAPAKVCAIEGQRGQIVGRALVNFAPFKSNLAFDLGDTRPRHLMLPRHDLTILFRAILISGSRSGRDDNDDVVGAQGESFHYSLPTIRIPQYSLRISRSSDQKSKGEVQVAQRCVGVIRG
jgi:hypothetical protein